MRAIFIRHGESTGNAGVPCHDLAAIELTERGHEQARHVAAGWTEAPALIVTSPYTRTRQTAAPTIARFPGGTRSAERMPHLEHYWSEADPTYCDGEGAESFGALLARCEAALTRLAAMPAGSLAYVFGHGQFIQAARAVVTDAHLDDRGKMLGFWRKGEPPAISNAERLEFCWQDNRWDCAAAFTA